MSAGHKPNCESAHAHMLFISCTPEFLHHRARVRSQIPQMPSHLSRLRFICYPDQAGKKSTSQHSITGYRIVVPSTQEPAPKRKGKQCESTNFQEQTIIAHHQNLHSSSIRKTIETRGKDDRTTDDRPTGEKKSYTNTLSHTTYHVGLNMPTLTTMMERNNIASWRAEYACCCPNLTIIISLRN